MRRTIEISDFQCRPIFRHPDSVFESAIVLDKDYDKRVFDITFKIPPDFDIEFKRDFTIRSPFVYDVFTEFNQVSGDIFKATISVFNGIDMSKVTSFCFEYVTKSEVTDKFKIKREILDLEERLEILNRQLLSIEGQ